MYKFVLVLVLALMCGTAAEATCTPPSNGTTADASALNTYLNCQFAPLLSPYFTGSVGIGTTTPLSALQVVGDLTLGNATAYAGYAIHTATTSGSDNNYLALGGGGASNDTSRGGSIDLIGNEFSFLGFYGDVAINAGQATSGSGGAILFGTDPTSGSTNNPVNRMIVTNAGSVGIGTQSPATALAVVGDVRVGTSGTNGCIQNFAGTALTGTCSSDARLKNVVGDVSDVLGRLANLQLVTFRWNDKAAAAYHNSTMVLNTGFLAQAVEQQFPELVSMDRLGYRQVDYSTLSLYSIEAIKELKATVDGQAAEIAALKTRLNDEDRRLSPVASRTDVPSPSGVKSKSLSANDNLETEVARLRAELSAVERRVDANPSMNGGKRQTAFITNGR